MSNDTFAVASIGFEDRDQNVLITVMALAKSRSPSFDLFESLPDKKWADIILVNADNPDSISRWDKYVKLNEKKGKVTSIMLCTELPPEDPDDPIRYISRPLVATRLLTLLEDIAINDHGFKAPLVFEGEDMDVEEIELEASTTFKGAENEIKALVVDDSLPVRIQMFIDKNVYDVIFLDVILPGVDGYDICKEIKQDPVKGNTPVIMLTSNSSPADRVKGKLSGCDTYLIKPLRHDIFEAVVREYLDIDEAI
jgi:twitching motility two-component system response regulator PilG